MKKSFLAFLFITFILSASIVFSHGEADDEYVIDHSEIYPVSQLQAAGYGSLIFGILVLIIVLFHKTMSDIIKKIVYFLVIAVIGVVTLYLILTTLHLNIISVTKGPVHWHADFEIWVCDKEVRLSEPKGLSNRQGVDLLHAHNDNRIHVEGVILDKRQASLGAFFHAVGGDLNGEGFAVPTDEGLLVERNGYACNDKPAKLYVFVNGKLTEEPHFYVIAPYEKIPPGDRIKFVFTEKPIEGVNPDIS